jgi:plasmid stabilization system protein ParE
MPKHRVEITKTAESDLREILLYIAADNEPAATRLVIEIERQIDSLERYPSRCPIIPESTDLGREYRHIIYGQYRTVFRIDGFRVLILRILHSARLLSLKLFER